MAGGQAIEGEGVTRRPAFNVPPELLVFDVEDEHVLYELDRERVEDLDEDLILSIMAVGIRVPVEVAVEKDPKGNKRYVVTDGRRRVVNALEANKRLKKIGEPPLLIPVEVVKGDDDKLAEIAIALNELRKPHSVMAKAYKAARLLDRVKDEKRVARAFGVDGNTVKTWIALASMSKYAKDLADAGTLSPSALVKFAGLSSSEQKAAIEKFLAETGAAGVKPTASRAGAARKPAKEGNDGSGLAPARRTVTTILAREDLRAKLDPNVVKALKWLLGELDPKHIGGLTGILGTLEAERAEKAAAKAEKAARREAMREARRREKEAAQASASGEAEDPDEDEDEDEDAA